MKNLLFVMSPQKGFLDSKGLAYLGEEAEILKVRLVDYLKTFPGSALFLKEIHSKEDDFYSWDKTHSVATTRDTQISPNLLPYVDKILHTKRHNAFYDSSLDKFLKNGEFNSVTIVGVETHTSVLFTAEELRNRGFPVSVVEPCVMSRDTHMHAAAISLMRNYLGVKI